MGVAVTVKLLPGGAEPSSCGSSKSTLSCLPLADTPSGNGAVESRVPTFYLVSRKLTIW